MNKGVKEVKSYILNNKIDLPVVSKEILDFAGTCFIEETNDELHKKSIEDTNFLNITDKSPFFSRDFSETGERLNSYRTRRHKKRLQVNAEDNNILLCDTSESEPLSLIEITNEATKSLVNVEHTLNKVSKKLENDQRLSQYTKDTFVIKMDDGVLSIQDIKKLESFSDLDSSCDTSLNFIESSLSGDNNNFDLHSLEYNSDSNIVEKFVGIPKKYKSPRANTTIPIKEKKILNKEFNQITVFNKNIAGEKNPSESKNNNFSSIAKLTETKLNAVKKSSPKIQQNKLSMKDKTKVPQTKYNLVNKGYSSEKIHSKHTITSLILNSNLNSPNKTLEKCSISEKMTASTRAKVKAKVPINPLKPTLMSKTNSTVHEKKKYKNTAPKSSLTIK